MIRRVAAGRRGFTLIEVLIALSVLGVTMTAAFSLFSAGLKLRSATRDRMAFDRDARLVVAALRDDLANLVPSGPAPMVSADSIVLWRLTKKHAARTEETRIPELVTYQWSGSVFQDSMLVRVATPLAVDVTNYELVHQEFMKWARVFQVTATTTSFMVREDHGSRFGSQATLNELSGSWVAYPCVQGFACGITEDLAEHNGTGKQSRILLKLSPEKFPASTPWLDPSANLALLPNDRSGIEVGMWLPLAPQIPFPLDASSTSEVQQ